MGSRVSAVPRGFRTPSMMPSAAWTSASSCSSVSSVWARRLRLRFVDVVGLLREGGNDRPGRLKERVLFTQLLVFAPDREEPAVMRRPPVPARPLALLDDLIDGRARRRQIPNRDELRPAEPLRGGLRPWLTHEQHRFAGPA